MTSPNLLKKKWLKVPSHTEQTRQIKRNMKHPNQNQKSQSPRKDIIRQQGNDP